MALWGKLVETNKLPWEAIAEALTYIWTHIAWDWIYSAVVGNPSENEKLTQGILHKFLWSILRLGKLTLQLDEAIREVILIHGAANVSGWGRCLKKSCCWVSQTHISKRIQIQWQQPENNMAVATKARGGNRWYQPCGFSPNLNCQTSQKHSKCICVSHEQPPRCLKPKVMVKTYWPGKALSLCVPWTLLLPSALTSATDSTGIWWNFHVPFCP